MWIKFLAGVFMFKAILFLFFCTFTSLYGFYDSNLLKKETNIVAQHLYNYDKVVDFVNEKNKLGVSSLNSKEIEELYFTILTITENRQLKKKITKELWEPAVQSEESLKKALEAKRKNKPSIYKIKNKEKIHQAYQKEKLLKTSYKNLILLHILKKKKLEDKLLKEVKKSRRLSDIKENISSAFYKINYLLMTNQKEDALQAFISIKGYLNKKIKSYKSFLKDKDLRKINSIGIENIKIMMMYRIGAILMSYSDKDREDFTEKAKSLSFVDDKVLYYYITYKSNFIVHKYHTAAKFFVYVLNKVDASYLKEEYFRALYISAIYNNKNKNYETAWIDGAKGIEVGLKLDYKEYYKYVLNLKRVIKKASKFYIDNLYKSGNAKQANYISNKTKELLLSSAVKLESKNKE
jgi:hypothetical protein